jgi:hypothetical protein
LASAVCSRSSAVRPVAGEGVRPSSAGRRAGGDVGPVVSRPVRPRRLVLARAAAPPPGRRRAAGVACLDCRDGALRGRRRSAPGRRGPRHRRKNSVLKLMAASLLAEGTTRLTNVPEILDVPVMAELLQRWAARSSSPTRRRHRRAGPSRARGRLRPGPPDPRLHRRPRTAGGPLGEAKVRPARRRRDRQPPARHAHRGPREARRPGRDRARLRRRPRPRLTGTQLWLDFPSVGAPRTCSWRPCWPRAPRASTTPRASPRSSTCARCSCRWAPSSAASARRRSRSRASTALHPTTHATVPDRSWPAPGPSAR